ncbi:hypothetical protein GCM10027592_29810 [Spirosoma flavus]
MLQVKLKFEKILELYVFRVTERFIDRVDTKAQAKLIKLYKDTDKEEK